MPSHILEKLFWHLTFDLSVPIYLRFPRCAIAVRRRRSPFGQFRANGHSLHFVGRNTRPYDQPLPTERKKNDYNIDHKPRKACCRRRRSLASGTNYRPRGTMNARGINRDPTRFYAASSPSLIRRHIAHIDCFGLVFWDSKGL